MKIAYIGNFTLPFCTEVHIAKTLENMGHEVTLIQENLINPNRLIERIQGHQMLLFTRTWGGYVKLQHLVELKELGIPTVSYHLDLYVGLKREAGIEDDPFWRTEYVFSADGDPESQKYFEARGINHHWLMPAVFEEGCYMAEPNKDPKLQGDVIFVGAGAEYGHPEWPYRHQLVKWLEENYGSRYQKYGHPQRVVRERELNQLYANAKISIGDSVNIGFKHRNYTSDRLFESMGRGAFTIYPRIQGIEELFEDGKEIIWYDYGDFQGLKDKIDHYLTHDDEREAIRKAGFEKVKREHTYRQRMDEIFNVVWSTPHLTEDEEKEIAEQINSDPYLQPISKKINLGAGNDQTPGWVNVDMMQLEGIDVVHNLINFPYPFDDESADEIKAVDVLEHLPPYIGEEHGVIKFINECHRILQPGGVLYLQTPGWKAEFLWIDPTHVRGFDIQSMDFFDPDKPFGKSTGFYSPNKFHVKAEELPNHNLRFWMEKI